MIPSFPSIYNLGHAAITDLLKTPVIVEEKVDGSQFSFCKREDGELECRSKGAPINLVAPEGMFTAAVELVKALENELYPGYVYRGEYLAKPKHNVLCYNRAPARGVVIFDINSGNETYLSAEEKRDLAAEIGLETVPVLFSGIIEDATHFRSFLEVESFLGGQKVEGVVIKPMAYDLFGRDKKVLMGKFVSEHFKEVHKREWKDEHGTKSHADILQLIAFQYANAARWQKAVIHLEEAGKIEHSPRDIGTLMAEIPGDVLKECEEDIKSDLMKWAWPQLRRIVTRGLPEWYKEQLLKRQFEPDQNSPVEIL